jgi:hypothetical protein
MEKICSNEYCKNEKKNQIKLTEIFKKKLSFLDVEFKNSELIFLCKNCINSKLNLTSFFIFLILLI